MLVVVKSNCGGGDEMTRGCKEEEGCLLFIISNLNVYVHELRTFSVSFSLAIILCLE